MGSLGGWEKSEIHAWRAAVAALDALVVHKAGSETITGDKTFTGAIIQAGRWVQNAASLSCPPIFGLQTDYAPTGTGPDVYEYVLDGGPASIDSLDYGSFKPSVGTRIKLRNNSGSSDTITLIDASASVSGFFENMLNLPGMTSLSLLVNGSIELDFVGTGVGWYPFFPNTGGVSSVVPQNPFSFFA